MRLVLLLLLCTAAWPVQAQSDKALRSQLDSLIQARAALQRQLVGLEDAITDVGRELSARAHERLVTQGVELYVAQTGWLRDAPSPDAEQLIEVPEDMRLKAHDYTQGFWQAEYRDTSGYFPDVLVVQTPIAQAVKAGLPPQKVAPPVVIQTAPAVELPEATSDDRLTTAVRCNGITKKGAQCKRTTTHPSGFCYQHQH